MPRSPGVVLVVDDEPAVRALVGAVLRGAGHGVVSAAGGAEALDRARAAGWAVDLLVTEVPMPGMTGPELAERLRAHVPGLPVLFVCASHAGVALAVENAHLLRKPFPVSALTEHVGRLLGPGP